MSAYIVEKKTIDAIVTELTSARFDGLSWFGASDANALGQMLWELNHAAVDTRYSETSAAPIYFFSARPMGRIGLYKAIGCLVYQCSEGSVPETDTYKKLVQLKANIADKLIGAMPGFEEAAWG